MLLCKFATFKSIFLKSIIRSTLAHRVEINHAYGYVYLCVSLQLPIISIRDPDWDAVSDQCPFCSAPATSFYGHDGAPGGKSTLGMNTHHQKESIKHCNSTNLQAVKG